MPSRVHWSLALAALIGGATPAAAAPVAAAPIAPETAQLWINIDRWGNATGILWLSEPPARPEELAKAFGATLGTPTSAPDQGTRPRPWLLGGRFSTPLARHGMQFSGSLDLVPLMDELHAQELEPLEVQLRYPASAFARVGGRYERQPVRAEYDFLVSTGSSPEASAPMAVEFGFTRRDIATLLAFPLGAIMIPLPLVAWLRRRALRKASDDPARVWFGYWRSVQLIQSAVWLAAVIGLTVAQPYRLAAFLLPRNEILAGIVGTVVIYLLPAALASVAIAALSHAVSARVRGVAWTLRETVMQSVWHMAATLVPFAAALFGIVALLAVDRRLGVALIITAVVARFVLLHRYVKSMGWNVDAVTRGELRDRVFALAAKVGVRLRQLYVIPMTRNPMANAFAVRGSTVVLTDYLLAQLTRREVDAVLAHELIHLKRRHAPLLMLTLMGSVVATCMVLPFGGGRVMFILAVSIGSIVAFSMVSRRFERQADAGAISLTNDPESLISALAHLSRINCVPLDWSKWDEQLLTHPSTLRRARAIAAQAGLSEQRVAELVGPRAGDVQDRYPTAASPEKVFSSATKLRTAAGIGWRLFGLYVGVPAAVAAAGGWTGEARGYWDLATAGALVVFSLAAINVLAVEAYPELRRRLGERLRREGRGPEPGATFVGLAPGPHPRVYENFFDWDLGFVRIDADVVCYEGEETRFALGKSQVRAIEICPGSPGWISSRRVRVSWEDAASGTSGCFTLRPADARLLTRVTGDARRLHARLVAWWKDEASPDGAAFGTSTGMPPTETVTGLSPGTLGAAGHLLAAVIISAVFAAAACALMGASFFPSAGMGFLDVWAVSLVPQLVQRIPLWLYRDRIT